MSIPNNIDEMKVVMQSMRSNNNPTELPGVQKIGALMRAAHFFLQQWCALTLLFCLSLIGLFSIWLTCRVLWRSGQELDAIL